MNAIRHGALQAFLAVTAGAFGAHGLEKVLDEYGTKIWHTGVTYHLAHALALVLVGIVEEQRRTPLRGPHVSFGIGILLFSGSLYVLALSGVRALGMITPLGGVAFLVGWLWLAYAAKPAARA